MAQVEISDDDLFELASLVYSRWAAESDLLKNVKQERDDGSKDWWEFHNHRLTRHTAEEKKWAEFRDRMVKIMPRPRW